MQQFAEIAGIQHHRQTAERAGGRLFAERADGQPLPS